jgi:hypothetical protein
VISLEDKVPELIKSDMCKNTDSLCKNGTSLADRGSVIHSKKTCQKGKAKESPLNCLERGKTFQIESSFGTRHDSNSDTNEDSIMESTPIERSLINDSGIHGDLPSCSDTDEDEERLSPTDEDGKSLSASDEDDERSAVSNKVVVTVPMSRKSDIGTRVYDRKHACYYCGVEKSKMGRHLTTVHKLESEIMAIAKASAPDKNKTLDMLRIKGDFYHNLRVLKSGGALKVFRRPSKLGNVTPDMYTPCTHCLAFLVKHELWRHVKHCPMKALSSKTEDEKHNRKLMHESDMLLHGSKYEKNSALLENVISTMKNDDIKFIVKNDEAITRYGSFLFSKSGVTKKWYIS